MSESRLWVGSETADMGGSGIGITALVRREDLNLAEDYTLSEASPTFLAAHPRLPIVYAALEGQGRIQAYSTGPRPGRIGPSVAAGEGVCHLTVTGDGAALIATCVGSGQVLMLKLNPEGRILGTAAEGESSVDIHRDPFAGGILAGEFGASAFTDMGLSSLVSAAAAAERPSRARASVELADGRIATTDSGHDAVRFWSRDGDKLRHLHDLALPFGTGPGRLIIHPSGHLHVVAEHSCEVYTLTGAANGSWRVSAGVRATADSVEPGDSAAGIVHDASGERLYMGIRGSNRISVLAVTGNGDTLKPIADRESAGVGPRDHVLSADVVHVANHDSDDIATFRLDARGIPGRAIGHLDIGSPNHILAEPTMSA